MEIIKIERKALLLDTEEKNKLIACLKYVKHRLVEHKVENGIKLGFVEYMIDFLSDTMDKWD